jgi:2-polyprenyl-3-methyl-5-hydroxy-6-metoxy-1,4-benzoquinol methylase
MKKAQGTSERGGLEGGMHVSNLAPMSFHPRARAEIHGVVQRIVAGLGSGRGKAALDAPMGPGAMAQHLHTAGYAVSGIDLDLEQSAALRLPITRLRADLNGRLPFADASFDLITSLEGIEHIENHFQMLREFGRVAKLGACLIISTPNICNLEERLNFLMRGAVHRYISRAEVETQGPGFYHQNLISYVELRQVVNWAGFHVIRVEKDRPKWKQVAALWPLWLMIRLFGAVQSPRRKAKYLWNETNAGSVLLGGNTVIMVAQKASP